MTRSLHEGIDAIARGQLTSEQWTRECLARIAALEPRIETFVWLDPEAALTQAAIADARTAGALRGAPLGVKDIIDTRGVPTRMGSPAFGDNTPTDSATVVKHLDRAGAFVLGKTVTAELAFYTPGKTRNPWNPAHSPGGSSSGSAAAVAAGFVPAALGTQTNGSIIRPAAYCGCIGFKPSFGLVSRAGVFRFSATLDQVGFFTRSVEDTWLLLACCVGADAADPASVDVPLPGALPMRSNPPRLVAVRSPVWDRAEPAAQSHFLAAIERLRAAGAQIEERELPAAFQNGHAILRTIMYAEGARSLNELKKSHGALLSAMVHALIDEGSAVSEQRLREALERRAQLIDALREFLGGVDAIVTPPATGEAPATLTHTGDPSFCTLWTLCGAPAVSLPSGRGPHGLPLGTQLVGKPYGDAELLATARWCDDVLGGALPRTACERPVDRPIGHDKNVRS
ncbi:MAG: amidase [Sulfurifustaceae bacterium]